MPPANPSSSYTSTDTRSMLPPLARHSVCIDEDIETSDAITMISPGGRKLYSHEGFRWSLLRTAISSAQPLDSVCGPLLHNLVKRCPWPVEIPKKEEMQHDIDFLYDLARKRLKKMLKVSHITLSTLCVNKVVDVCRMRMLPCTSASMQEPLDTSLDSLKSTYTGAQQVLVP